MKSKKIITIFWLLGYQCSGKTTVTKQISSRSPKEIGVINIGEEIRKTVSTEELTGMSNSYAPTDLDSQVYRIILKGVKDFIKEDKTTILIDSAPKSHHQIGWLKNLELSFEKHVIFKHTVVFFNVDRDELRRRTIEKYGNDVKCVGTSIHRYVAKRASEEEKVIPEVLKELEKNKIGVLRLNDENPRIADVIGSMV